MYPLIFLSNSYKISLSKEKVGELFGYKKDKK